MSRETAAEPHVDPAPAELPPPAPPRPILVVEDHPPTRYLRTRVLRDAGFPVTTVETAADALATALVGPSPPAAVVLDVGLPDGDGFTVCERIKAAKPRVPILMITAVYRTAQARRDGFNAGADAYLIEPTPAAVLVRTLRRLVSEDPQQGHADAAFVTTTTDGRIIAADKSAARLFNLSPRGMMGRAIQLFFDQRGSIQRGLELAGAGQVFEADVVLRPRDRRPVRAHVDVALNTDSRHSSLDWSITPHR
jgi:CheY-like chemotaxis protein